MSRKYIQFGPANGLQNLTAIYCWKYVQRNTCVNICANATLKCLCTRKAWYSVLNVVLIMSSVFFLCLQLSERNTVEVSAKLATKSATEGNTNSYFRTRNVSPPVTSMFSVALVSILPWCRLHIDDEKRMNRSLMNIKSTLIWIFRWEQRITPKGKCPFHCCNLNRRRSYNTCGKSAPIWVSTTTTFYLTSLPSTFSFVSSVISSNTNTFSTSGYQYTNTGNSQHHITNAGRTTNPSKSAAYIGKHRLPMQLSRPPATGSIGVSVITPAVGVQSSQKEVHYKHQQQHNPSQHQHLQHMVISSHISMWQMFLLMTVSVVLENGSMIVAHRLPLIFPFINRFRISRLSFSLLAKFMR